MEGEPRVTAPLRAAGAIFESGSSLLNRLRRHSRVARRAPTRFAPAAHRPPRRVGRRTFGHGPGLSGPLTWGARLLFNRGLGLRQGRCATRDDASVRTRAPRRLDRNRRWRSRTGRSLARGPRRQLAIGPRIKFSALRGIARSPLLRRLCSVKRSDCALPRRDA
jgi:hypothetical protein